MSMYRINQFNRKKTPLRYSMPFARILPYGSGKEPDRAVVLNKNGSMQTTWSYCGPDLGATVPAELAIITQQLNNVLMTVNTGFVFYFEASRHMSDNYKTTDNFPDPLSAAIDEERQEYFARDIHYESDYFCTLYWMPPSDTEDRLNEIMIEGREHKDPDIKDAIKKFMDVADRIVVLFNQLQIPSNYLNPPETLSYLHSCVSDVNRPLQFPEKPLPCDSILYDTPLYGGLEPRLGKKHMRVVAPTKFAAGSVFGFFDSLNQLDFPYRWVTRYYCLSKPDSIDAVESIKKKWYGKIKPMMATIKEIIFDKESTGDENVNAVAKFDEAKDAITSIENDTTSYGFYSTMVVVLDDTEEGVDIKAKAVVNTMTRIGLNAKIETLNAIDAWMGSIPGNVGADDRRPMISVGNLIHMMPLSNIWPGQTECRHLGGPPLVYTETTGHTPFRLNLHVRDVGHSMMVGQTGGGKSVHLNLIEAQFRKYKNARIFVFDKGATSIALTLGVGGSFYDLGSEEKGGVAFQPLVHVDDVREQEFLLGWLSDYLESQHVEVTPEYSKKILAGLKTVAEYKDPKLRRMTNLVAAINDANLKTALTPLTVAGAYGRIFDSDNETLSFSNWQTFEMEKLMNTKRIVGSVLMYIFHRIEQSLDGSPTLIVLDECWVFFSNEQFAQKIAEWLRVLRKSNASVLFATQQLTDIVNSPIFDTVNTNCDTKIFLPYKKGITEDVLNTYQRFGLNARQVNIINQAVLKRDYYYSSSLGARLYNLALENCPLTMAFIAINSADVQQARKMLNLSPEEFRRQWLEYKKIHIIEDDHEDNLEHWEAKES